MTPGHLTGAYSRLRVYFKPPPPRHRVAETLVVSGYFVSPASMGVRLGRGVLAAEHVVGALLGGCLTRLMFTSEVLPKAPGLRDGGLPPVSPSKSGGGERSAPKASLDHTGHGLRDSRRPYLDSREAPGSAGLYTQTLTGQLSTHHLSSLPRLPWPQQIRCSRPLPSPSWTSPSSAQFSCLTAPLSVPKVLSPSTALSPYGGQYCHWPKTPTSMHVAGADRRGAWPQRV